MGCIGKTCAGITAVIGIVAIIFGANLGWTLGPWIVKTMVHLQLDLTDVNSDGYKNFIVPPVTPRMKFYFFEVENYKELIDGTAPGGIPDLREVGPYTFMENREKSNLSWSEDMKYLNFGQYKFYTFLPEESCDGCTEEDEVRILNMPAASGIAKILNTVPSFAPYIFQAMNELFNDPDNEYHDELFKKVVVADFLFRGYKDGVVKYLMEGPSVDTLIRPRLPDVFRENGFALFNGKVNSSEKECYNVSSSEAGWDEHTMINMWGFDKDSLVSDLSDIQAKSYLGNKNISRWWPYSDEFGREKENSTCNIIKGTDGAQFPPYDTEDPVWIFNTVPCRSLYFEKIRNVEVEGIKTQEYGVPLEGANVNRSENVCTCEPLSIEVKKLVDGEESCVKRTADEKTLDLTGCNTGEWPCYDGVMDITNCQGSPFFLSYPHFYLADKKREEFNGLEPDVEKHRTYLNVEPYTGMTVDIHNRIQLNTVLYNWESLGITGDFDVLKKLNFFSTFPFLWLDLTASITNAPDQVDKLKSELVLPLLLLEVFAWVIIGIGIALTVLGVVIFFCKN